MYTRARKVVLYSSPFYGENDLVDDYSAERVFTDLILQRSLDLIRHQVTFTIP